MSTPVKSTFTEREMEILAGAFQSLKNPPDIDFDKLAAVANFKNGQSARACFAPVKKKLAAIAGGIASSSTTTTTKPTKKPAPKRPKKRNASVSSDETVHKMVKTKATQDSDDETHVMPYKGKGKGKAVVVKKEVKEEVDGGAEDDEEMTAEELVEREVAGVE